MTKRPIHDWWDGILHAAATAVIALSLARADLPVPYDGLWAILLVAFWFHREAWQQAGKGGPLSPLQWSAQKHYEWMITIPPALLVFL